MHPVDERIRRDRVASLCALLADEVAMPFDTQERIVADLLFYWAAPDGAEVGDLEKAIKALGRSGAVPLLTKSLLSLVDSDDEALVERTLGVLVISPDEFESSVSVLARVMKRQAGRNRWRVAFALSRFGVQDDWILGHLKNEGVGAVTTTRSASVPVEHFDASKFQLLYEQATNAKSNVLKGRTLENLTEYLFLGIPGLQTIGRNIRTLAEEIDLAFSNEGDGFWRNLGDPFVVECKNRIEPVDASMIRDFGSKLQTKGLRGGFVVTTAHLTKDATFEIRNALRDQRAIVAIEKEHLETIATGKLDPVAVLRECFYKCHLL